MEERAAGRREMHAEVKRGGQAYLSTLLLSAIVDIEFVKGVLRSVLFQMFLEYIFSSLFEEHGHGKKESWGWPAPRVYLLISLATPVRDIMLGKCGSVSLCFRHCLRVLLAHRILIDNHRISLLSER